MEVARPRRTQRLSTQALHHATALAATRRRRSRETIRTAETSKNMSTIRLPPIVSILQDKLRPNPLGPEDTARLDFDLGAARQVIGRIMGLVGKYRWRFALATATSLGASIFNLALPHLLGRSVDAAHSLVLDRPTSPEGALHALTYFAVLVLGAATMRGLLQMVSGFQSEVIGQNIGSDLRLAFFEKLQRLGFDYHDRMHSGELITRGMLDLEGVRGFVENGLQRSISLVLLVGVGSTLLFGRDPLLAALTLSFVPIIGWRAARMGLALRLAWTKLQERMAVLTRIMEENLQGTRVVRAFFAQTFELDKFDAASNAALELSNKRILVRSNGMTMIGAGYYLTMTVVLWVGGHRVASGHMTIGQLTEFLTFMTILQMPVRQIGMIMNSTARAVSSGKRLFEVLDLQPTIRDSKLSKPLAITKGELCFEEVRFAYDDRPGAPVVLDGISFRVRAGETLGIVGPSGAGKSTLAHLIPRFYDVTAGRITIDGQDIRDVTLESLREAVGVVQQDLFLFDDSVESNVAYADPDAEEHELIDAASAAQIHTYVSGLPLGYGTRIGERGVSLSGGQRQRLTIARGMVPDPAILVFDDATSAIDAATEKQVRQALRATTTQQATIIISHRLGSLLHADEIIVLDNGRISERGAHGELIRANGIYAALYQAQRDGASKPGRQQEKEHARA
jgi:ATP-binding cassette subfamily B protein